MSLHPDVTGRNILPQDGLASLAPLSAQNGRHFSNVMADAQGQPTIYLVEELPNGETAVGAMGIDYITKLQRHITFGELGHAAIVDSSGNIIAHPNKEWSHSIKNISKVKPVKHMINGESGVTEFYSPAVKADMITGYTVVPGVGWGLMVPQLIEELRDKAASARGA